MQLNTAQGAITALKSWAALVSAYASYDAGHDDKHRSANAAYGANHGADDPDRPQGYYQKVGTETYIAGTEIRSVWGKAPAPVSVFATRATLNDITKEQEKEMLWAAVKSSAPAYYPHANDDRFLFCCDVPANYRAFTFEGGGAVFPKMPSACAKMVLVVTTGGKNIQLVTHFPASASYLSGRTALT